MNTTHRISTDEGTRSGGLGARSVVAGGVAGNARLTALLGALLLILLFIEGMTLLQIRALITVHVFVGFLLIPPIALKLASTGYRFVCYYTGNQRYRAAGPPHPLLRVLAPALLLSTVVLLGSGIALLVAGPQGGELWRRLHILSFLLWFCVMTVHVLGHLERASRLTWLDLRQGGTAVAGVMTRRSLVMGSVVLGFAVALATLPLDASWVHWLSTANFDQ